MELEKLLSSISLKAIGREMGLDIRMTRGRLVCTPIAPNDPRHCTDFVMPSARMVEACRANDFSFFQPFIDAGHLSVNQMHHAAARYCLGKTRSGRPMYWMMDDRRQPLDAHIGRDTWVSQLLRQREPLLQYWRPMHCLFGLHLLTEGADRASAFARSYATPRQTVCIVEREETAVVLSELFPESLWMAYATVEHLEIDLFAPLEGCTVVLYPYTDPCQSNYLFFYDLATAVHKRYPSIHITVDSFLEEQASDEQKARGVDLLEYLQESLNP